MIAEYCGDAGAEETMTDSVEDSETAVALLTAEDQEAPLSLEVETSKAGKGLSGREEL